MHETFIKAMAHGEKLATVENASAWLFRIATNTAYDHLTRRRHRSTPLADVHAQTLVATPAGLPIEDHELLRDALSRIPAQYRIPLVLQGYAGYPIGEIAALMGWKVGTVKSRIYRARAQLQRRYGEEAALP